MSEHPVDNLKEAIGIFDSGVGGLTVLKEIRKLLPYEDTVYLGDTARVPYGIRSEEAVIRYSFENSRFLLKQGIKLLVVACNTASAFALNALSESLDIPVIGVIEPGVRKAVNVTKKKRVGVIGTEGTIRSGAYQRGIKTLDKDVRVFARACPLFVPLVEEGWIENEVAEISARIYLDILKDKAIDTLVLGCTHYPLLKGVIGRVIGNGTVMVDSSEETALMVYSVIKEKGLFRRKGVRKARHTFFVTDFPERFKSIGRALFKDGLCGYERVEVVNFGD